MQPFPSPPGPERRGRFTAIALLAAGFLVTSTIAVVQFVQLRAANERIEELKAGGAEGAEEGGGLFGDLEDLFGDASDGGLEDLLGDAEGLFEGTGDLGSLLKCLGPGASGPGDAGTTVGEIAAQVEAIRELEFDRDVEPRFLSDQEMTERVRELFLEEYTPRIADLEQRLLTTLGAIPRGTDLRELRADTVGQQVAGFYDTETKELVVRQAGADLSALDRITLAHELTHALTDQALGIPLPDEVELGREDADLAALAVVEGDATLVMQRYSTSLGFDEQFELLDPETIAQAEGGLEDFPPYLEQELLFPYEQGLTFVCALYESGGWEAVDRAYESPPTSTRQILFPERYLDGPDDIVDLANAPRPGKGWELEARLQLGAANLLWLFEAPGGDPGKAIANPREAAGAVTGGEATLWSRGDTSAVEVVLSHGTDADRWCGIVDRWYRSSFSDDRESVPDPFFMIAEGPRQYAAMLCEAGNDPVVRLGIGPDLETASRLALPKSERRPSA